MKQVLWTGIAEHSLYEIVDYWNDRNKSSRHSNRLVQQILTEAYECARNIKRSSDTEIASVRFFRVYPYHIYFRLYNESLLIMLVWDARRNPDDLIELLERV